MNNSIPVQKNITVTDHPLAEHNLGIIRNKDTDSDAFKSALKRLSTVLVLDALKELNLEKYSVQTPLLECSAKRISDKVMFVPILRAGLALSESAAEILPEACIQHVGMYRDEDTLEPVWYYDKTPKNFENPESLKVFILDPMLATGNSAHAAINLFIKRGISVKNITFVSVLASPQGINLLIKDFPDLKIITAKIDECLNSKGYIVPGLGDAGDRLFNTFHK
jgi:uracil phosphoribosyltransferase